MQGHRGKALLLLNQKLNYHNKNAAHCRFYYAGNICILDVLILSPVFIIRFNLSVYMAMHN